MFLNCIMFWAMWYNLLVETRIIHLWNVLMLYRLWFSFWLSGSLSYQIDCHDITVCTHTHTYIYISQNKSSPHSVVSVICHNYKKSDNIESWSWVRGYCCDYLTGGLKCRLQLTILSTESEAIYCTLRFSKN